MLSNPKKGEVDIFAIYSLSVVIVLMSIVYFFNYHHRISQKIVPHTPIVSSQTALFNKNVFAAVKVEAKAYIIYDIVTEEIIASKNIAESLPLASITKVMTAISATLHKEKNEKIIVTAKSIEGGYDLGLKENQVWTLSELLKYMLIFSSNDGAEIVADSFGGKDIFVKQMNSDGKALGLTLYFTDPAGRDIDGKIGGRGTVLEVAKLFSIARKKIPEIMDATTKKRETVVVNSTKISGIPNTNQAIETLPGAEASKTGYTEMAGGNLGVIVDVSMGHPVVIVVLGSSKEGRFKDMSILYKTLRDSVSK